MVWAVNAVAVASQSSRRGEAPQELQLTLDDSCPNISRGGFAAAGSGRTGWKAIAPAPGEHTAPSRHSAVAVHALRPEVTRAARPSMIMFPGPVSKATTFSALPPAGSQVTLAIPPMFWMARGCGRGGTEHNRSKGREVPPAPLPRHRTAENQTRRQPAVAATAAALPSWSVTVLRPARPGSGTRSGRPVR